MDAQAPAVFLRSFSGLADPRRHNVRHRFTDILGIAILAVMCRADDWDEVVIYGRANRAWLATFLALPNGIPSIDTFARLFARLDPAAFERAFIDWTASLATVSDGRLSRLRKDHGAENMSRLRRIVLNKLKTDRSEKRLSLKNKRYKCSLDRQYLIDMLQQ